MTNFEVDTGAVKNLDEIQEDDPSSRPSRLGALVLASLGGACIVLAAALIMRAPAKDKSAAADPLGDLVARAHPAGVEGRAPERPGVGGAITFPSTLSDTKNTTALEAVRDVGTPAAASAGALPFALPPGAPTFPPPATDRLPVVPLPAQYILEATPSETPAGDRLHTMARQASAEGETETVAPGGPGGHQLQVSSFKTSAEAEAFAKALRRRGHRAYVEPANVKGRGLWHRVRIGPFKHRHAAIIYRQDFEAKERMVTFIVDPPKTTVRIQPD
jgi:cell division septation protein DedD